MTRDAARATLARHSYIPGKSRTAGMQPEARAEIKAACRVLAAPADDEPTPAPAPAPVDIEED